MAILVADVIRALAKRAGHGRLASWELAWAVVLLVPYAAFVAFWVGHSIDGVVGIYGVVLGLVLYSVAYIGGLLLIPFVWNGLIAALEARPPMR